MSNLTEAFEARFGPAAGWPLKIHAAHAQFQIMQRRVGDDYNTYLLCARRAAEEHRARTGFRSTLDVLITSVVDSGLVLNMAKTSGVVGAV
ncbi:hypothetical protein [Streptomyces sp. NPDC057494]|uniref:hypothetical protein n=1 Tax=Streptomyces sp. NPDC057494 TaxID=3346148 RepID=UPI0036CE76BE